jgi:hypothetical protein
LNLLHIPMADKSSMEKILSWGLKRGWWISHQIYKVRRALLLIIPPYSFDSIGNEPVPTPNWVSRKILEQDKMARIGIANFSQNLSTYFNLVRIWTFQSNQPVENWPVIVTLEKIVTQFIIWLNGCAKLGSLVTWEKRIPDVLESDAERFQSFTARNTRCCERISF